MAAYPAMPSLLPRLLPALFLAAFTTLAATPAISPHPRLHLAGDSTMADKPQDPPNPEHGWGQLLPALFFDPAVIVNHAVNGRSTKSFRDLGHWDKLRTDLLPGDFVLLQFGHNDEKTTDPVRFAAPTAYAENLRRYIAEIRAAGAHPLLATPVARRQWDDSGHLVETHGDYLTAMREVATTEAVPLLELNALTAELERVHGLEGSKRLHLWLPAGRWTRHPAGLEDDTHYSAYGATCVATLAVRELIRLQLTPATWLK